MSYVAFSRGVCMNVIADVEYIIEKYLRAQTPF